eukprot:m.33054 g.33054  ORF g.33054 m.33054 type:complete len:69 (-) comp9572_c0_seq1:32-238(-)
MLNFWGVVSVMQVCFAGVFGGGDQNSRQQTIQRPLTFNDFMIIPQVNVHSVGINMSVQPAQGACRIVC